MMNFSSMALALTGLALSGSTFRRALMATRDEGPSKLCPLVGLYWLGLFVIVAAGVCQMRHILCAM